MNNPIRNSSPLIGIWGSEMGLRLGIKEFTDQYFKGWLQCLDGGNFRPFRNEIKGWVHAKFKATVQLVFFCNIIDTSGLSNRCAFTCEVRHQGGQPHMQLYWLEYSAQTPGEIISHGFDLLKINGGIAVCKEKNILSNISYN